MKNNISAIVGAILFWSVLAFLILQPNIGLANPCGGVSRVISIIVCFILGFTLTSVSIKDPTRDNVLRTEKLLKTLGEVSDKAEKLRK